MTFNEALHEECRKCGETAAQHRLTKSGTLYCLMPRSLGQYMHTKPLKVWASTVRVSELVRSPIPTSVGETINKGLGTFV